MYKFGRTSRGTSPRAFLQNWYSNSFVAFSGKVGFHGIGWRKGRIEEDVGG
jgi:hypothetical protein